MQKSKHFIPIELQNYNKKADELTEKECSESVYNKRDSFLHGNHVLWGIPFVFGSEENKDIIYLNSGSHQISFDSITAPYLVFAHASDIPPPISELDGMYRHFPGDPPLNTKVCEYIIHYKNGEKLAIPIRSRMEINNMCLAWGQESFLSVPHDRSTAFQTVSDDIMINQMPKVAWGASQYRTEAAGAHSPLKHWLFAWENPHPDIAITGLEIIHHTGRLFMMGITAGLVQLHPLRYGSRKKIAAFIEGNADNPFDLVDIDLGHIISVIPRPFYDNENWETGSNNELPLSKENEYLIEFNAHDDACLYLGETKKIIELRNINTDSVVKIMPAEQPVKLIVRNPQGQPVPVKVHAHGVAGEYLPPRNRHRIPNTHWFEDYSVDYAHDNHWCTYIDGVAEYLLPQGEVFFEVSKGFEIKPIRCRFDITPDTSEIEINLERMLDWRSLGWVTADTHVHFLSPNSALLESEAEDVNVVNLLASQWGELYTNIGDFDGKTETKSSDEYIVRVGTENRQHILGHISLLGYSGAMILPLTTGGPDESALGDPVDKTLTQWAEQCRKQSGINILPHFPNPRGEGSAAIVSELIDGVEMTSWGNLYLGIDPYSLSDWYRYLNCGYHVAAVGGTDKMSSNTAIGTIRTYAMIDGPLSYQAWMDAIKVGRTFVTYGALCDMRVDGKLPGSVITFNGSGTLNVEWTVASATIPITSVELIVSGDTVDGTSFDGLLGSKEGSFNVNVDKSCWIALRIRGHYPGKPEIIIAHTSAVMIIVDGIRPINNLDAVTILEQIEGVTAYVKTIGTKAQEQQFKKVLMTLTSAHRKLHNRLHELGHYHKHSSVDHHEGH